MPPVRTKRTVGVIRKPIVPTLRSHLLAGRDTSMDAVDSEESISEFTHQGDVDYLDPKQGEKSTDKATTPGALAFIAAAKKSAADRERVAAEVATAIKNREAREAANKTAASNELDTATFDPFEGPSYILADHLVSANLGPPPPFAEGTSKAVLLFTYTIAGLVPLHSMFAIITGNGWSDAQVSSAFQITLKTPTQIVATRVYSLRAGDSIPTHVVVSNTALIYACNSAMVERANNARFGTFIRVGGNEFVPVDAILPPPPQALPNPSFSQGQAALDPPPSGIHQRGYDTKKMQEDLCNLNCIRILALFNGPVLSNLLSTHLSVNQDIIKRIIDSLPDVFQRLPYVQNLKLFQYLLTGMYGAHKEPDCFTIEHFSTDGLPLTSMDAYVSAIRMGGRLLDVVFKRQDRFLELLLDSMFDRFRQISDEPALIFRFSKEMTLKVWRKFGIFLRNPNTAALPLQDLLAGYADLFSCSYWDLKLELSKLLQTLCAENLKASSSVSTEPDAAPAVKKQKGGKASKIATTTPLAATSTTTTTKPPCMSYVSFLTGHGQIDCTKAPKKHCSRYNHLPLASYDKDVLRACVKHHVKDQVVLKDILAQIG